MKGKILVLAVVVVAAVALLSAGAALAGVSATRHNLSSSGPGTIKAAAGQQNNEICVWCHTPHSANIGFTGAPLWNKATPAAAYTMYGATVSGVSGTTIAGTTTDATPNGVTKACLSCHDGVSAVNSIVNQAGQGGVVAGGTNVNFGTTVSPAAYVLPAGATNLGTSLADDHPVSINYIAGRAGLVATTTPFGTSTINALLRNGKVECGSCHDPHANVGDIGLGGVAAGPMMMRSVNSGSTLCLYCHNQ